MVNIAVLISWLLHDCQKEMIKGIKECAKEYGCNIYVFACMGDAFQESVYCKGEFSVFFLPDFTKFDGVILASNTIMYNGIIEDIIKRIRAANVPVITIDDDIEGFANIHLDNKMAMKEMVQHLINHHKYIRILFVSYIFINKEMYQRFEGYQEAMAESGLSWEENWIYKGDFSGDTGRCAIEFFEKEGIDNPEAIVCTNDELAINVIEELHKRNIKVPEQIAVTGFDNTQNAIYYSPQVASVTRFQSEVGYNACKYLLNIYHGVEKKGKSISYRTEIFKSTSCGCPEKIAIDKDIIRRKLVNAKYKDANEALKMKQMYSSITSFDHYEEFHQKVKNYVKHMNPNQFYLCINCTDKHLNNSDEEIFGYNENCLLAISYYNGEFEEELEHTLFKTADLLPLSCKARGKGDLNIVLPIHFGGKSIGYMIIDSEIPMESDLFYTWISNLGILQENIKNRIDLKKLVEKLGKLWMYDSLTGLYNRAGLKKYAPLLLEKCQQCNKKVLVFFMDLDGLKFINDFYGHDEGDKYIRLMSDILNNIKKEEDLVVRYGGDEFVMFIQEASEKVAESYLKEILFWIDNHNNVMNNEHFLDVSIGYTIGTVGPEDQPGKFIELADKQMYIEKNKKKLRKMVRIN